MLLEWFSCTRYLHQSVKPRRRKKPYLPDDIIILILSSLPAECVLKFRRVCKKWLVWTSSPYFAQIHLERALPVVLVRNRRRSTQEIELFTIDERAPKGNKFKKMKKAANDFSELMCSCNGLLLLRLRCYTKYVIFNPVTLERVTIEPPLPTPPTLPSSVFAIFFHPQKKDYRLLFWRHANLDYGSAYEFFIYSCRSKTWRELATFNHVPMYLDRTLILNNTLYWKKTSIYGEIRSIITFDMDTEKFNVLSLPGAKCSQWGHEWHLMLLEAKGWLLCVCILHDLIIKIWKLEDYEKSSWVRVGSLSLGRGLEFEFANFDSSYFNSRADLPDLRNESWFYKWLISGLRRHHLSANTFEELQKAKLKRQVPGFLCDFHTVSYTKSFVSVRSLGC